MFWIYKCRESPELKSKCVTLIGGSVESLCTCRLTLRQISGCQIRTHAITPFPSPVGLSNGVVFSHKNKKRAAVYTLLQVIDGKYSKQFIEKSIPDGTSIELWLTAIIVSLMKMLAGSLPQIVTAVEKATKWIDTFANGAEISNLAAKL